MLQQKEMLIINTRSKKQNRLDFNVFFVLFFSIMGDDPLRIFSAINDIDLSLTQW